MMNYQKFTEEMLKRLKEYYGSEAEVSTRVIACNNNEYREVLHIVFTGGDAGICPAIYLDSLYEKYCEDKSNLEVLYTRGIEGKHGLDVYVEMVIQMRNEFDSEDIVKEKARELLDWNIIKDDVYPILVSKDGNEQFLANFIYTSFLDFAVIYEVRSRVDEKSIASSKISHGLFCGYEITKEELHEQAIRNMKKEGYLLADIMSQVMGLYMDEEPDEVESLSMETGNMYVLTNRRKRHGAAVLLDEELLEEKIGSNSAYIIPSSIHETIWMLVDEDISVEKLNQIICEVNQTRVEACERLSNHCYFWDGEEKKVKMAA